MLSDATDYTKLLNTIRKLQRDKMVRESNGAMILKEGPVQGDPSSTNTKQEPDAANAKR